ncbi:MAG: ferric siderophore ABC transporter substrate-binding protein [Bacteroidetes bacterium]|jgi:outer membrane biosynthesis protein TonB|nr:ferric siderophore ABC transporter substrate-binding protein [Bacteroidota bacterium]
MSANFMQKKDDNTDKVKSGIITAIIWSVILFFLFWYKIIEKIPPQQEVVARMLINFGDNRNGNGAEEPANQEGSQASKPVETPIEQNVTEVLKNKSTPIVTTTSKEKKENTPEKIITGNNDKKTVNIADKAEKNKDVGQKNNKNNSANTHQSSEKKSGQSNATQSNAKNGKGDGKGNLAIGNLLSGRGKNKGSQGVGQGVGNNGDPLGGDGNGDSKIGIDRKLIGYIPGTMGRGGNQPPHNCTASGTIIISYTVDKSGNVIAARRSSGISDPCAVATTIAWVKKFVKAEKSSVTSTGIYSISF